MCKRIHGREGICVYVLLTEFKAVGDSRADWTIRPATIGERQERERKAGTGFYFSSCVFCCLRNPAGVPFYSMKIIYFLNQKDLAHLFKVFW